MDGWIHHRRDTELRLVAKFGENRCKVAERLSGLPHKETRSAGLVSVLIFPQIPLTLSPLDMYTYTEFGPDRLRFAGLFRKRLIFGPNSNYNISFQRT